MRKVLCEKCAKFIRYEPYETDFRVTTEQCPYNCSPQEIARHSLSRVASAPLSEVFPNNPDIKPHKVGILGY